MPAPSHAIGPALPPLLQETIGRAIGRVVRRFADREALVVPWQGYRATYAELWAEVTAISRGLIAMGILPGDRVALWSPNRYEWVVLQLATARVGAILVNLNPAYRASELEHALQQSGATFLFLARRFRSSDFPALVREVHGRCPQLRNAVVIDDAWKRIAWEGRRASPARLAERDLALSASDPINIQYTSGTTGRPKGATLSHRNVVNNAWLVGDRLGYTEQDRICVPVPFYHCFGMVMGNLAGLLRGACLVVPGESFDPAVVLGSVRDERCTSLYGVPTMFIAELALPRFADFDLSSLRTGIMAGANCPIEVLRQVRDRMHMKEVAVCYGMTETSPVSTQTAPDDPPELRVSTVGKVLPHVEVKIVSADTGEVVPRGEVGELCTRGHGVMIGYWNDEAATKAAVRDGWMHTGDLASMDDAGYVRIEGRLKDTIIRGGENISPREVEEFLHAHPAIADVHIVGFPSEKYGEEVMAWVKLRPGAAATGEELAAYCHGRIATFKIPVRWRFVDEFPMTVTGKIQKYRLREMARDADLKA